MQNRILKQQKKYNWSWLWKIKSLSRYYKDTISKFYCAVFKYENFNQGVKNTLFKKLFNDEDVVIDTASN